MNASHKSLDFRIPAAPSGRAWRRAVDTALPSPDDIVAEDRGPRIPVLQTYPVRAHSMIILVSEANGTMNRVVRPAVRAPRRSNT